LHGWNLFDLSSRQLSSGNGPLELKERLNNNTIIIEISKACEYDQEATSEIPLWKPIIFADPSRLVLDLLPYYRDYSFTGVSERRISRLQFEMPAREEVEEMPQ